MTTREEYEQRRMQVADYLIEHPGEFLMTCFGYRSDGQWTSRDGKSIACGTVGCIAGTALLRAEEAGALRTVWAETRPGNWMLNHVVMDDGIVDIDTAAAEYLGLSHRSGLFYDFSITNAEVAAKRLLDEPYVNE